MQKVIQRKRHPENMWKGAYFTKDDPRIQAFRVYFSKTGVFFKTHVHAWVPNWNSGCPPPPPPSFPGIKDSVTLTKWLIFWLYSFCAHSSQKERTLFKIEINGLSYVPIYNSTVGVVYNYGRLKARHLLQTRACWSTFLQAIVTALMQFC